MKKLFALLLCLGVMLGCAVCVSADNVTTVEIISPVEEVTPGEEITFEVHISATEACSSFGIVPQYDHTVFEIVDGECELGGALLKVFDPEKGFAYLFENATAPDGLVGTFVMKVKESAPAGSAQIEATLAVKNASETVPSTLIPAQVRIVTGAAEQNPEELKPAETIPATEAVTEKETEATQSTEPAKVVQEEVAPVETVPAQTTATETGATQPEAETQPKQTEAAAAQPALPQKPAAETPVPTELIIAVAALVALVGALIFCCVKLSKNKKTKK